MEKRPVTEVLAIASILIFFTGCSLGPPPPPLHAVSGPETTGLVQRLSGYLVTSARLESGELSAIRVVALPSLDEHMIRPTMPDGARFIHALSGPDEEGRIALIQQATRRPYLVKIINVDGSSEREIARMQAKTAGGKHEWLDPGIGEHVSLSPVRGRVAFIRDLLGHQMPGARTKVGTLEIWDIEPVDRRCTNSGAVDWGIAWFPDGRRVAYVEYLPRTQVPMPSENDTFGKVGEQNFQGWSEVPAIMTFDVETHERTVVGLGTYPVVSASGHQILVRDLAGNLRAIDFATRKYSSIEPPGLYGEILAYLPGERVLYRSRPTEGQAVLRSPYGSFRAGIQMLPIKVCDLSTGEFQTIIEAIDPRHQVSYGGPTFR